MQLRQVDPAVRASLPLARAAGFATLAVPVSVVAHLAGGGPAPDAASGVIVFIVLAAAHRLVLAGRERSWPVVLVALGLAQVAAHLLFGLLLHGTDAGLAASGHAHAQAAAAPSLPGPAMVLWHLGATLVLGWFARTGERCLWSAARRTVWRSARRSAGRWAMAEIWLLVRRTTRGPVATPPALVAVRAWVHVPAVGPRDHLYRTPGGRLWRGPPRRTPRPA